MIEKPDWLICADEVREQLSRINDTKNGECTERHIGDTYFKARNAKGYAGSLADWKLLLRRRASVDAHTAH